MESPVIMRIKIILTFMHFFLSFFSPFLVSSYFPKTNIYSIHFQIDSSRYDKIIHTEQHRKCTVRKKTYGRKDKESTNNKEKELLFSIVAEVSFSVVQLSANPELISKSKKFVTKSKSKIQQKLLDWLWSQKFYVVRFRLYVFLL